MRICSRDCTGIAGDAGQTEQGGRRGVDLLRQHLARHLVLGGGEGAEDRQRQAGLAAGRVDAPFRRRLQSGDAFGRLRRFRQPLPPACRHLLGIRRHRQPLLLGVVLVDPLRELAGIEVGKLQKQVGQVALGVDDDARDAVDGRLFEQADAQAGLARAGHADDDAVRRQIAGVVHDVFVRQDGPLAQVVLAAEVEASRLLDVKQCGGGRGVVGHGHGLRSRDWLRAVLCGAFPLLPRSVGWLPGPDLRYNRHAHDKGCTDKQGGEDEVAQKPDRPGGSRAGRRGHRGA